MGARFGLRAGGFAAAVACTLLVACGGGGGGGGTPVTPTTTTPVTPALNPQVQQTQAPLTTAGGTAQFGGVSNGTSNVISSGTVTIPNGALSGSTTATITMTALLPTAAGGLTPAVRKIKARQ